MVAQRPLGNPRHFGPVRSLWLWRSANFEIGREMLLLCVWRFALVVVQCEFWDRSCYPLLTCRIALAVARCEF